MASGGPSTRWTVRSRPSTSSAPADPQVAASDGGHGGDGQGSGTTGSFTAGELLEAVGQAVVATDADGVIVFWNSSAERLYGWSAAEALGRNIIDVTVPHMSQEVAADIMDALRRGQPWSGGFPVQHRDGTVFPALVTDAGIRRDGALVGVVGVSANLGTAIEPLLERSADAALMLTADGIVTYASPAVTALFGWPAETLIGKTLLAWVHPQDQDVLFEFLHGPAGQRPGRLVEIRVEVDGDWVWAEAALSNLLDDPLVRGVVCNLRHSERITRWRERERINDALHADTLQELFGATLDLEALLASAVAADRPRIQKAADAVRQAITALRTTVQPGDPGDLDPPAAPRCRPVVTGTMAG